MDKLKEKWEKTADEYDEEFIKIIPKYEEAIYFLIKAIPFDDKKEIKVLDLGCGTGTVTKKVKERYPNSIVTSVDLSENMIKMTKEKLKGYENIKFVVEDFKNFKFEKYDVVVSHLAIHHLKENKEKIKLYTDIYNSLNENGIFLNSDLLLSPSNYLKNVYDNMFMENLKKQFNKERIDEIEKSAEEDDYPSKLYNQLKWLEEIGFKNIEVVWKYLSQATYGGEKILD